MWLLSFLGINFNGTPHLMFGEILIPVSIIDRNIISSAKRPAIFVKLSDLFFSFGIKAFFSRLRQKL